VWLVPATGGTPRQLTYGERGESQPSWSPDGSTIAFVTARGAGTGDDAPRPQLWLLPADGGEARQITTARDGVSGYAWSPDGAHIAYLTTDTLTREQEAKRRRRDDPQVYEADFRLSHIWVVNIASGKATKVSSGAFTVSGAPSWSPDSKRLAFAASPTPMIRDERRDAYVADVATQTIERITTTNDVEGTPQFSPDGKLLAWQRASGAPLWTQEALRFRGVSMPLAWGQALVVGDQEGWVHALSPQDGQPLQRIGTDGSAITGRPVAVGQTLVVVTRTGGVFGFRPE
jgi:Tol biopolymer transport system component